MEITKHRSADVQDVIYGVTQTFSLAIQQTENLRYDNGVHAPDRQRVDALVGFSQIRPKQERHFSL